MKHRASTLLVAVAVAMGTGEALAQVPAPPPPLQVVAPRVVATGVDFSVRGSGAAAGEAIRIEVQRGARWRRAGSAVADAAGRFAKRFRPRRARHSYTLRAAGAHGTVSPPAVVRSRDVTLAAVGDINLGDGPALAMARFGRRYPWTGVARALRRSDVAFGNLECAVSTRGSQVPKEFNFRGRPAALRVVARYAGFDVLNLANNHTGDYGTAALLDTVRHVRRLGMTPVGAGGSIASASAPRVLERLGLKVPLSASRTSSPPRSSRVPGTRARRRPPQRQSAAAFGARAVARTW